MKVNVTKRKISEFQLTRKWTLGVRHDMYHLSNTVTSFIIIYWLCCYLMQLLQYCIVLFCMISVIVLFIYRKSNDCYQLWTSLMFFWLVWIFEQRPKLSWCNL